MKEQNMLDSPKERRDDHIKNVRFVFGATAELYYELWGEFFHLAVFEEGDDLADFNAALERTHERYFNKIRGAEAGRILELACGGGALSAWMAERTRAEVVGLDISDVQLARARKRLASAQHTNLRFIEHDIMRIADLDEAPFDAGIYLDAACYLPDKRSALQGIATQFSPGARLLLVDWCRAEHPTDLQEEMILKPFNRYWSIPGMETISGYERDFEAAGFRIIELEDLSASVAPGWERGYQAANRALAEPTTSAQLLAMAASAVKYGTRAVQFAKEQFYAAVFAKIAADAGVLRYVSFLVERL
jgi:SAM-dependent methyltransferase